MKTGVIVIIIVIVVVLAGIFLLNRGQDKTVEEIAEESEEIPTTEEEILEETTPTVKQTENIVEITSTGFAPSTLTIKKEETVIFVNKDSSQHWPASVVHPTHKVYPGSDINKCGTAEESQIFDACKGLSEGESYSFKFSNRGSWNYHDHLNPSSKGIVVVS